MCTSRIVSVRYLSLGGVVYIGLSYIVRVAHICFSKSFIILIVVRCRGLASSGEEGASETLGATTAPTAAVAPVRCFMRTIVQRFLVR